MAGLLTKGSKLSYSTATPASFTELHNMRNFPDFGSTPEQVDVTCLEHSSYHYIPGLVDYGTLEFTFVYDGDQSVSSFTSLKGLADDGTSVDWKFELPDGTALTFSGKCAVTISGGEVNGAIEFVLTIFLDSDMEIA